MEEARFDHMRPLRFVLALAAVAGCSSSQPKPTTPAQAPAAEAEAPPASTTAPAGEPQSNTSGRRERAMANCPSAVPGARTVSRNTEDGVDLAIIAESPDAERKIRHLAHAHARLGEPSGLGVHTGEHTGTGRIGYCPIVQTDGTTVTATDVPGGVQIHLHAARETAVTALQQQVAQRVAHVGG
jgi:hypothetical protein